MALFSSERIPDIRLPVSDTRFVAVARYATEGEAQLAKARLEAADVPCLLANEAQAGLTMMFDGSASGVQVKVPEDRADEARSLL